MFYDAIANTHGLAHDPFKSLIVPRPIGWISTLSAQGVRNLAPYSFFNAVSENPHYVMFGSNGVKDSARNIAETGEFVCSLATVDLKEKMNATAASVPSDVDEFELSGLTPEPSHFVKPPRVKESPVAFECRHFQTIELPPATPGGKPGYRVVFGLVVGIHIDDRVIKAGVVDTGALLAIARLGHKDYAVVSPQVIFQLQRPG